MLKDAIVRFDTTVTNHFRHWPSWLHTPMSFVSDIGHPVPMGLIAMVAIALAWPNAQPRIVQCLIWGMLAMAANSLLKHYIHRTRPDTLYVSNMYFKTSSFPSGHAFGTTVICGLLMYLSLNYLPAPWSAAAAAALTLFILIVGISRVYLGAHFPTDVLAGWALGGLVVVVLVTAINP